MKKNLYYGHSPSGRWRKTLLLMKLKLILLLCCAGSLSAGPSFSQRQKIDAVYENKTVVSILDDLKKQTGVRIAYMNDIIPESLTINLNLSGVTIEQVLDAVLLPNGFSYQAQDDVILISKNQTAQIQQPQTKRITGKVANRTGEPLAGASIVIQGGTSGVATDAAGTFELSIPIDAQSFEVRYVGMVTQTVTIGNRLSFQVVMEEKVAEMEQVVVTGVFTRARESYTGAATTITSQELRRAGNRDLLTTIRNVDPSFNIVEDIMAGSDPNSLPEITVRGRSSLSADIKDVQTGARNLSNTPLFIMDGFEISLERMMDLDQNQIESVTLLKDASATALYGTRGANGVVVITTRQPEAGRLLLTYKGGTDFEIPDLSYYNMLNAREKLAYEWAAGLYEVEVNQGQITQSLLDLYNARLKEAERGVDTYWLKYPIRTGIGHNHSLRIEGGEESLRYGVSLAYKDIGGAMKGSARRTFNGNIHLSYNLKNIIFQNNLEISHNKAINSPYGSFSNFASVNAYWKPYDDEGNMKTVLDDYTYYSMENNASNLQYNPLYNALLPGINESRYTSIINNFAVEWSILPELTLRGRLGLNSRTGRSDYYKSARHTDFINYTNDDYQRRGSYRLGWDEDLNYETDVTLNYNKNFDERHQFYAGLSLNAAQERGESYSITAEGFTNENADFLPLAAMYEKGGKPGGSENISRRVGGILNVNYTFDRRYFVDISGKIEASSMFGSDNRMAPFWSAGAGWNIHHERFMENNNIINQARLRVSYGTSGSQNFDPYMAMRTYRYYSIENYNGFNGVSLINIGNSELGWQKTKQLNIGVEVELFRGRIRAMIDVYDKLTDDTLGDITLPSASGFDTYKANIGKVSNKGVEISANVFIVRNTGRDLSVSVGGSIAHNKNKIMEISNTLEFLNKSMTESDEINPSFLFKEGQSMNTIFAVPSLGIDPSNGLEIYRKIDGTLTYTWDTKDKVPCGIQEPQWFGSLNSMLRWRGFTLNAIFGIRWGGQIYNSSLANKVENISPIGNVDRRVLYDRWKEPGDQAKYKSVRDMSTTKATSRFVNDENTFQCRTLTAGYEWHTEWLRRNFSISYLSLSLYGEDLFRISSVKQEMGINYPFSRKFSLSLTARF